MDFGVVFPQTEIGPDPEDAKELIQASEQMGFEGLVVYDHVVGANTDFYKNSGIDFFYDIDSNFHEIFVLLGWAAAITQRIKLITGIVILPQRQTTLVAKQAAAIDVLSGGRLVLGIAVGWNPVEFEALGEDFHNRGKRIEEQIDVMRALWTKKVVNYQGRWHTIRQAGIKPFPVQQPIPLWIGGDAYPVLKRTGRLGDAWFPTTDQPGNAKHKIEVIREAALEAGRDPSEIAIAVQINLEAVPMTNVADYVRAWQEIGASKFYLDTMHCGFDSVAKHLDAFREYNEITSALS